MRDLLRGSPLASLPPATVDRLLAAAFTVELPAGSVVYRAGDAPRCGVLLRGLLRVYAVAPDGRQATLRYMRPGSLSGSSLVVRPIGAEVCVQAVTDATGLLLRVETLRELAHQDARVAWALAEEVARSQDEIMRAFAVRAFGSLRQRLARHLLDVAAEAQTGPSGELFAALRQQELADAVGTAREVVARTLRDLGAAGLVETSRRGVRLRDPSGLHAVAEGELGDLGHPPPDGGH